MKVCAKFKDFDSKWAKTKAKILEFLGVFDRKNSKLPNYFCGHQNIFFQNWDFGNDWSKMNLWTNNWFLPQCVSTATYTDHKGSFYSMSHWARDSRQKIGALVYDSVSKNLQNHKSDDETSSRVVTYWNWSTMANEA